MNTIILKAATKLAAERHGDELRKGGNCRPYISHPLQVVERLGCWGLSLDNDPSAVFAALLHDALEDVPQDAYEYWAARIAFEISPEILSIVKELTFRSSGESPQSKSQQKAEYIQSFGSKTLTALCVKVADRLCNVRNFLDDGDPYAGKYFLKATSLFEVVVSREAEFSTSVYQRMIQDIEEMRHLVGVA